MILIFSAIGITSLCATIGLFIYAASKLPLGALSLPCVTALTTLIYFYLMPAVFLGAGHTDWFGVSLVDMDRVYFATTLYAAGAALAFWLGSRTLSVDVTGEGAGLERSHNPIVFRALLMAAVIGILIRIWIGGLVLGAGEGTTLARSDALNFLNLSYSVLICLAIFQLVRTRFGLTSIAFVLLLLAIFLMEGFRFRIVILLTAALSAFFLVNRIRIRTSFVTVGAFVAILVLNVVGMGRTYGRGFDISKIEFGTVGELFSSFGGEIGPMFVLYHMSYHIPELIYFEPWVNTITGFIPTFLWPDKPYPEYLLLYSAGFPDRNVISAGTAATQHSEFLLQFGWWGLPVLSFIFFSAVVACLKGISRLGYEGRVAGYTIVPTLFGFYAQQRGYTFQVVAEGLFTLGPVFLLYVGSRVRVPRRRVASA